MAEGMGGGGHHEMWFPTPRLWLAYAQWVGGRKVWPAPGAASWLPGSQRLPTCVWLALLWGQGLVSGMCPSYVQALGWVSGPTSCLVKVLHLSLLLPCLPLSFPIFLPFFPASSKLMTCWHHGQGRWLQCTSSCWHLEEADPIPAPGCVG